MEYSNLGPLIALIGLVLLLVINLQRQTARKRQFKVSASTLSWIKWGSLAAYALIMIGLFSFIGRK